MAKDPSFIEPSGGSEQPEPERDLASEHTIYVQQMFVKHQTGLKAFILSLQPVFAEAEDILQEVFLVVTRKAGDFRPGTNFLSWAFSIARFKVLESFRQSRHSQSALSEEVLEALADEAPEVSYFDTRLTAVSHCLDNLAPRMKEMIKMRYFAEQGPSEIAARLARTPNSVNVALANARRLLHKCVGQRIGSS